MIFVFGLAILIVLFLVAVDQELEILEGLAIIGFMFWFVSALVAIRAQMSFVPGMRVMAEVRHSVERLGCTASGDVMGAATQWNADITEARYWNTHLLGDPFVSDGFDTVTAITIPECR